MKANGVGKMPKVNIRRMRFREGMMTQEELSKACGIHRSTISEIENGSVPSVRIAKKLADFFDFDWRDLYD